ncbi:MAG: bifunctional oligoribonuclease/PAP phosphatase NrnA [Patescibacteria group bacterium]
MHKIFAKIATTIKKSNYILLTAHRNFDGDSLGSIISFIDFLENIKKEYSILLPEKINADFNFLPHLNLMENKKIKSPINDDIKKFDTIIILDSADTSHTHLEQYFDELKTNSNIINIDHHMSNPYFGHINCVNAKASSTAEIVFDFLKYINYKIDKKLATALLCGIACDTEIFYNSATNQNSTSQAAELLRLGANLNVITKKIFKNQKINYIKFFGMLLSKIKFNPILSVLTLIIKQDDLIKFNVNEDDIHGMANILKNIREAEVVLILKETKEGKIKGSLRSKTVDVSKLATVLGGGGHRKAAGFAIDGKLMENNNGTWKII